MIKIIDTYPQIDSLFVSKQFNFEGWKLYINSLYNQSDQIFIDDLKECLNSGSYVYERDIFPVINAVYEHPRLAILYSSFCKVTKNLNQKVIDRFGCELNIDIVLYVGLCNAAGWVTNINGRDVILLGIEKILELDWCDEDSMRGLIYHELGHVYHKQYGILDQQGTNSCEDFVWQLFTEGIAMYFEQFLVNDFHYYHQNKDGWLHWCDHHFNQILKDFQNDLPTMTKFNQRYFGDWVSYNGKGDVGYYLGTKFVQQISNKYDFEQLINLPINTVYREYLSFTKQKL